VFLTRIQATVSWTDCCPCAKLQRNLFSSRRCVQPDR